MSRWDSIESKGTTKDIGKVPMERTAAISRGLTPIQPLDYENRLELRKRLGGSTDQLELYSSLMMIIEKLDREGDLIVP